MLTYFLLILGFVFVVKGADFLVDGASSIAKKYGVSSLVIGLTIVAFGTSAPELVVNMIASFQGNTDIAIGNVLGSNIANVLLILGIAALIFPLKVTRGTTWKEIPLSLVAVLAAFFFANDRLVDGRNFSEISRIDGIVLLLFFAIFIYYTFGIAKIQGSAPENGKVKLRSLPISIVLIVVGMVGLFLGGKWVVENASEIARSFGLSESLIGLTIVAIGTSLPELATSAVAAYKKNADIAVGNIVGSNIFNVLWILGLSSTIKSLPFNAINNFDMLIAVAITLLLFITLFIGKKRVVERWQGGLFITTYVVYITYLIMRG